jgi:hypothetical protein
MLNFDNLYLVKFELATTYYLHEPETETRYQLVIAESSDEAIKVVENHYQSKTSKYAVYYDVTDVEVIETIQ